MDSITLAIDENNIFNESEKSMLKDRNIVIVNDYTFDFSLEDINLFILISPMNMDELKVFITNNHDIPYFIINQNSKLQIITFCSMLNYVTYPKELTESINALPSD
jgi:hypothetical protein